MAAWGMLALGEPRGRVEGVAYAHMREHTRESPHCLVSLSPDLFWLLIIFEASRGLLCICMLWYEHSLCSCMHVEYLERPRASTRPTRRTDNRVTVLSPCSASRPCRPRPCGLAQKCRKDIVNVRTTVQGSLVLVQFRTRTGYRVRRVNALAARELLVVFLCVFDDCPVWLSRLFPAVHTYVLMKRLREIAD